MAKSKLAIGIDIGSSSVKLCQLSESKKGYVLEHFALAPLPAEAIVEGAVMDANAVSEAILEMISGQKFKIKDVSLSISGHSVIIKKISMPIMTSDELKEQVRWEAEQYIPFDIHDVYLDAEVVMKDEQGTGQMEVLLVAAKKDLVNDMTSVITAAGLKPTIVDVDVFALQNSFEINYFASEQETVVLVNVGASVININVLSKGYSNFTRDIIAGCRQYEEEIQKQLGVSAEEAEAFLLGGKVGDEAGVIPKEVEPILFSVSDTLAGQIQRSLDFFAATNADRIYLSGGGAKIPALARTLEEVLSIPVEIFNPFKNIDIASRGFDEAYLENIAPLAAVSVGLALRSKEEIR